MKKYKKSQINIKLWFLMICIIGLTLGVSIALWTSKLSEEMKNSTTATGCQESLVPGKLSVVTKDNVKREDIEPYINAEKSSIIKEYEWGGSFDVSVPIGSEQNIVNNLKSKPGILGVEQAKLICINSN